MTELIVERIVALAKAGERDADRLADFVLRDLTDDDRSGINEGLGASGVDPAEGNDFDKVALTRQFRPAE